MSFITFYDKDFGALQNNSSLEVGIWTLRRKANDFDDFNVESEAFIENINPTFVIMKDERGRYKYGAFAGIPQLTNENKTNVQASDLKTIFNNNVLLQFGTYFKLKNMFAYMFTEFDKQVIQGYFNVFFDLSDIADIEMDILVPDTSMKVYNLWDDILQKYMKYYNLFMDSKIDLSNKSIVYRIARTNKTKKGLGLWKINIKNYGKWIASVNEAYAVVNNNGKLTYSPTYILNSQNEIGTTDKITRDLFPIKNNIVLKETDDSTEIQTLLEEGIEECLTTLIDARYNEDIEFNTVYLNGNNLEETDYKNDYFDTTYAVYIKAGEFYKNLPIGELYENQNGEKKIKLGYKADNIILYI